MATKTAKKRPARRTTARKPARKKVARRPTTRRPARSKKLSRRLAVWFAGGIANLAESRRATVQSRRDAAILRITHEGCTKCHGTGTIATHGKDGKLTGSKSCPAKPKTTQVSRTRVAMAARLGPDKNSGLFGWSCPCRAREKPRYRDAKTATAALKTHNRKKHSGISIGGTWYQQLPETAKPTPAAAKTKPAPVSKTVTDSGMTDKQWEAQNCTLSLATRKRRGLCWQCGDKGALYTAFGGEQKVVVCGECKGTGKNAASTEGAKSP